MSSMQGMMNNPLMKDMFNNPELMQQAAQMMQGGGMNPGNMQSMMSNPTISNMVKNPEFLKNAMNMMKSNP